jgi:putative ABC transport system permease protein
MTGLRLLLTLSVRNLLARRARTALTAIGIALGVAVALATGVTNTTLLASFNAVFDEAGGRAHFSVVPQSRDSGGFDAQVLERVLGVDGVVAAAPSASLISIPITDVGSWVSGGGPTGVAAGSNLILLGVDPATDDQVRDLHIVAGRGLAPGERGYRGVLIANYAEEQGVTVGDHLDLVLPAGRMRLEVIGLAERSGAGLFNGGVVAFLPLPVVQDLKDTRELDRIDVVVEREIADSPERLRSIQTALEAALGDPDARLTYPGARGKELSKRMTSYRLGLDMFSLVAVIVGGFLIYNTFAMSVAERQRTLGMLRAIALTRRQILGIMLVEALALSTVGSALGLGLGLVMAAGMSGLLSVIAGSAAVPMVLASEAFGRALFLGAVVSLGSALWPALQAARVSPLQAMRARAETGAGGWGRWGWQFGPALLAAGYLVFTELPLRASVAYIVINAVLPLFLLGAALVVAAVFRPLARGLTPLAGLVYGYAGRVGAANLRRVEGRVIVTVAALMLGLGMSVGTSALGGSFRFELGRWTEAATGGDLIIESPIRLKAQTAARLRALPGVDLVSAERMVEVMHTAGGQEDELLFVAIEPETRRTISSFVFVSALDGSPARAFDRLADGSAVFISVTLAERYNLQVGDTLTLDTPRGPRTYEIAAELVDFNGNGLMVYGSWRDLRRDFGVRDADSFLVTVDAEQSAEAVRVLIERRYGDRLHLRVTTVRDLMAQVLVINDQSFVLFDALAFIMVVVSAAGVVNTMLISVLERGKEIATLRSLGFTRGQVRRMVLAEAAVMGVLGGGLGLSLGFLMARMFIRVVEVLAGYELTYIVPLAALVSGVVTALAVSQLAALWPAARAAQRGIVDALKEE